MSLRHLSLLLIFLYLALVLAVVLNQRSLIYLPNGLPLKSVNTPATYGKSFQDIEIKNDFGSLKVWWLPQIDLATHPTILYCHGNGGRLESYAEVAANFYDYGWNVLLFDYAGYGASESRPDGFSELGLVGDGLAAHKYLINQGVKSDRILIWGHSLGASVAAHLASIVKPAGLYLEGGFPSLLSMAKQRYPWLPIFRFMLFDKFDTVSYLKTHDFPVLIMHAEHDSVIPLRLGQEIFEQIPGPKEWLLLKGINHNDLPSVHLQYRDFFIDFGKKATQNVIHSLDTNRLD